MSLDQMFAMLRNWGEGHTAFGQTVRAQQAQRPVAQRGSRVEGRKADPAPPPTAGIRAVIHTRLESGIIPPSQVEPAPSPPARPHQENGDTASPAT
jgi:hypothetical protein